MLTGENIQECFPRGTEKDFPPDVCAQERSWRSGTRVSCKVVQDGNSIFSHVKYSQTKPVFKNESSMVLEEN